MISVIMSVYNTNPEYLKEAILSILNQTYTDFEFIIINDCSTDEKCISMLKRFDDNRIIIHENEVNLGLTKSLNIGLGMCKGEFIARMDSDDVSRPDRLEKQLKYMNKENLDVIGSLYDFIPYKKFKTFVTDELEIEKIRMIFGNVSFIHSSAFIRRSALQDNHILYNENYKRSQDYGLWCDFLSHNIKFGICPEKLVCWRESPNQISKKYSSEQKKSERDIRQDYISKNYHISSKLLDYFLNNIDYNLYDREVDIDKVYSSLLEFCKNNVNKYPHIQEEVSRYVFLQMLYRLRNRKFDWLFSKAMIWCIRPKGLIYTLHSLRKEIVKL